MVKLLFVISGLAAFALPASANDFSPTDFAKFLFSKVDENNDGILTEDEYMASQLPSFGGSFSVLDANFDGEVTEAEYVAAFSRHHAPGRNA